MPKKGVRGIHAPHARKRHPCPKRECGASMPRTQGRGIHATTRECAASMPHTLAASLPQTPSMAGIVPPRIHAGPAQGPRLHPPASMPLPPPPPRPARHSERPAPPTAFRGRGCARPPPCFAGVPPQRQRLLLRGLEASPIGDCSFSRLRRLPAAPGGTENRWVLRTSWKSRARKLHFSARYASAENSRDRCTIARVFAGT